MRRAVGRARSVAVATSVRVIVAVAGPERSDHLESAGEGGDEVGPGALSRHVGSWSRGPAEQVSEQVTACVRLPYNSLETASEPVISEY